MSLLTITAAGPQAVPLGSIAEIIRVPAVSPVPLAPAWLIGLINHRGTILPMIDLAQRLGGARSLPTAQSRVLIATSGAGFLVQAVGGVVPAAAGALDLAALALGDAPAVVRSAAPAAAAREAGATAEDGEALLGVVVAGQEYAFALECVEAVGVFAADPAAPGTMGWRGERLPALSLRELLGAPGGDAAGEGRVAVLRMADGARAAVRVDGFAGILRVPARQLHAVPPLLARGRPMLERLCRLEGGALVGVLSAGRVMGRGEAGQAAAPPAREAAAVAGEISRFIVFRLGAARFAAPLGAIDAVLADAPLSPVPGAAAPVGGVRRLRGRVLPVIDLRGLAKGDVVPPKTLVCTLEHGVQAGFLVDGVERVLAVAPPDIRPAPALPAAAAGLVTQVLSVAGGALLPVLDLPRLLAAAWPPDLAPAQAIAALLAAA